MIHHISFRFDELTLDQHYICKMLGFADGILPEPFDTYVAEALHEADTLSDIRGAYCFSENSSFTPDRGKVILDGTEFDTGKTVAKELRNSENFALFICTAGKRIGERSQGLLAGENPVLGYVFDILGSVIVETATDLLQKEIMQYAITKNWSITNRYSPGYCHWSVADQHKLFSFFPENCCGISLTESALMFPIKSVSGIVGIGREVKYREYTCDLCSLIDCFHRTPYRITR